MPVVQTMKCPVDERKIVRVVRATDSKTRTLNQNSERIRTCLLFHIGRRCDVDISHHENFQPRCRLSLQEGRAWMMPKCPASA